MKPSFYGWMLAAKLMRCPVTPNGRARLLRLFGAKLGRQVYIHDVIFQNAYANGFKNLVAEDKATVQPGCILDLAERIVLREMATVSQGVILCTHADPGAKLGKPLAAHFPPQAGPLELGRGCWVGAGAVIMPGVTLGEMAVVAAGAVVTEDVPARTVVAGVPAQPVRSLEDTP